MADEIAIRILNTIRTKQWCRLRQIQSILPEKYKGKDFGPEHPLIEHIRELLK